MPDVVADIIQLLPPWMVAGLAVGSATTVLVAGIFYFGTRFLPSETGSGGRRISGSARRHAEIRDYLRAIDEPFSEAHTVRGCEVAFFLPDRQIAITFDAKQYFRLDAAGVFTVLCEEEMPGHQLGRRLPFETPTIGSEPTDADPIAEAFDVLGLPRTTDEDVVQSAYRKRVKEIHPDQGGDEKAFRQLQEAYATASNYCERNRTE